MLRERRGLPIGTENFEKIIRNKNFYVDKTSFIEKIIKDSSDIKLFTRPRRFGKTLTLSMLKYFFDIEGRDENKELFKGLYISRSEYMKYQGEYPVIFITLKDLKENTWEECLENISDIMQSLYNDFEFIREKLNEVERNKFNKIWTLEANTTILKKSLFNLIQYIYKYYGKKVVLLIDEYDSPLINAYEKGYYSKAVSFFSTFYSTALKTNDNLQMGVLTGILKVVKEGIFSGLNNIKTYTVLDEKYSDSFGLTEVDVEDAVREYGLLENMDEVKRWYNGYKFGSSDIYNPWSIVNYLDEGSLKAHWINTSSDTAILRLIREADGTMLDGLVRIFNGESSEQTVDISSDMSDMGNPQEIWQLLLFGGYLTSERKVGEYTYLLRLPNYEVQSFFKNKFLDYNYREYKGMFKKMTDSLLLKDVLKYEELLQKILLYSVSYHDVSKEEKFYHNLILGMLLYLDSSYRIKSNVEEGYGRTDVVMIPLDKALPGFIFEFKVSERGDDTSMEKAADEALRQITEKRYEISLEMEGVVDVVYIGAAFYGKKVKIMYFLKD